MTISGYDNAKFHRRDYDVIVETVIICKLFINCSDAVYLSHGTSILIALAGNIIHNPPVVTVL